MNFRVVFGQNLFKTFAIGAHVQVRAMDNGIPFGPELRREEAVVMRQALKGSKAVVGAGDSTTSGSYGVYGPQHRGLP